MPEPRTHYQISLTSRQAVGLFFLLLVALGVAFFFGLMTGLGGPRGRSAGEAVHTAESTDASAEALPPVETAVPTAVSSRPSRTNVVAAAPGGEATPPASVRAFDDASEEESTASLPQAGAAGAGVRGTPLPKTGGAGSKFWVQVAALSSRSEANLLSRRLSRRGFHTQIVSATGPRGKIFRVRAGPYASRDEAKLVAGRLERQAAVKETLVIPEGQ